MIKSSRDRKRFLFVNLFCCSDSLRVCVCVREREKDVQKDMYVWGSQVDL